jgi:hypothetical protein
MRHSLPGVCVLVVAVVAGLATTAGRASAGCGSHVRVVAPAGPTTDAGDPVGWPKPCDGPHCSNAPTRPADQPVPPTTPPSDNWAIPAARPDPPDAADGRPFDPAPGGRPAAAGTHVFHPPRA